MNASFIKEEMLNAQWAAGKARFPGGAVRRIQRKWLKERHAMRKKCKKSKPAVEASTTHVKEGEVQTEACEETEECTTVLVGNLPGSFTEEELHEMFTEFGEIRRSRFLKAIAANHEVTLFEKKLHHQTVYNNRLASVTFKSRSSADESLQLNGKVVGGHHLRVYIAGTASEHERGLSVFLGNLPFNILEEDVYRFFESCGKIKSVRIIRDSETGIGKGFGYVNFEDAVSVQSALGQNRQLLKDRRVRVRPWTETKEEPRTPAEGTKSVKAHKEARGEKRTRKAVQKTKTNKRKKVFHKKAGWKLNEVYAKP